MGITLNLHPLSPAVGGVLLAIKALGLDDQVVRKEVDLSAGQSLHTVPSIEDGGFCLWNSHAIVAYLASAYGEGGSLYPQDLQKRAKVDQWLHFSSSILYNRLMDMTEPLWTKRSKVVSEEACERAEAAFRMLDAQLDAQLEGGPASGPAGPWLCGEDMTIADLCCVPLVAAMEIFVGASRHFPRMTAWAEHCRTHVPGYVSVVEACRQRYIAIITSKMTA
ncbi:glutathione S-transferase 1-like [Thrips palmi]|uniref:Glutathione S-transferase 1-like n=1 Tax=Thrips palmi TaxID=161013 RepID=A0A6P9A0A9_THRPL|nr:glutathione S-transferase 1-like [Thrips palmi]XP_034251134.1 glutathione S-transferase 1-like [Thrips palmi]